MSPEELLQRLLQPDAALEGDEALTAALARAAQARRATEEAGLAHGEWMDGAWFDDEEAREQSRAPAPALRLAAAPASEGAPLRYAAEGWTLLLARRPDGGWSALLAGPTPATLELASGPAPLAPRTWTPLPTPTPPTVALLRLPDGRLLSLERRNDII